MAPTCLQPLLRYRSFAILFLTPLLLLPLPLVVPTKVGEESPAPGLLPPGDRAPPGSGPSRRHPTRRDN